MYRVVSILVVLMLSLCISVVACGEKAPAPAPTPAPAPAPVPTPAPEKEVIELSYAQFVSPKHPAYEFADVPWVKQIEEATNGRIKVTIYTGQTLCKVKDTHDAVKAGMADMGYSYAGYNPGRYSLSEVIMRPFLGVPNNDVGTRIFWELFNKYPEMQAQYEGVKVLYLHTNGPAQLHTGEMAVRKLEDIKGLTIRMPASIAPLYEILGVSPATMSAPEAYLALEKGVVDGTTMPWLSAKAWKFEEITKYHTVINHYVGPLFGIMNLDKWNSLPPDLQEALDSVCGLPAGLLRAKANDDADQRAIKVFKELGHEIIELSPEEYQRWVDVGGKPLWDKWVADREAEGLPGKAIFEDMLRLVEKYT